MPTMYNKIDDKINNIVEDKDLKEVIIQTLSEISDKIGLTVGPYGHHILINSPEVGHFMTKDGFTAMKHMAFQGEIANIVHSLITGISAQLVETVGDGSSTSVLAANRLYNCAIELIAKHRMRPKEFMEILEQIRDICIKYIKDNSRNVSSDLHELEDIATVSINNDNKLGKLVSTAYQETNGNGFVNVKLGKGEVTTLSHATGFQIESGYIDPIMINNPELKECSYDQPLVLMFDAGLHSEKWLTILNNILRTSLQQKRNIVLITSSYGKLIKNWFSNYALNCKNAKAPISLSMITLPNTTDSQFAAYEDLAIKLGAKIINTLDKEEDKIDYNVLTVPAEKKSIPLAGTLTLGIMDYAGSCERVVSTEKNTTFINSNGNKEMIATRINQLKDELNSMTAEDVLASERYRIKKRLAVLTDSLMTINVGGISEQAKIADKALIDDAVGACKAAIAHGYVRGNNITLMECLYSEIQKNTNSVLELLNVKDKYDYISFVSVIDKITITMVRGRQEDIIDINSDHENYKEIKKLLIKKDILEALFMAVNESYRIVRVNANLSSFRIGSSAGIDTFVKGTNNFKDKINIIEDSKLDVISPANTDIEIIKAITSMIGLLIVCKAALTKNFNSNYVDKRSDK